VATGKAAATGGFFALLATGGSDLAGGGDSTGLATGGAALAGAAAWGAAFGGTGFGDVAFGSSAGKRPGISEAAVH